MTFRRWSEPGEAARSGVFCAVALTLAGTLYTCGVARAQQPPAPAAPRQAPAAQRPPAAQQRPPAQQAPAQQPPVQQPAAPAAGAAPEPPKLAYTPWLKVCDKAKDPSGNAKQVCITGREGRTEAGQPIIAAALVEAEGEAKKVFRVTLPSPLLLQYGTRVIVDTEAPVSAPFFTCMANACMADYEATADLVGKLKKGQTLFIQAINMANVAVNIPLPLADGFQKANEGPPVDPKVLEEQQKKLEEERRRRQQQ
jgi:invasion protein IalB